MLRVSGKLVPGSLAHEANGLGISVLIADWAATTPLTVTYRGATARRRDCSSRCSGRQSMKPPSQARRT
jgi:hypothetical protein